MKSISYLLAFAGLILLPSQVFAKSYQISQTDIKLDIQKNGSMSVVEARKFEFNGDFTFAFQKINRIPHQSKNPGRSEPYSLNNFSVCDQTTCYKKAIESPSVLDQSRPENYYYVIEAPDHYYIKWFYHSDSSKIFTTSYMVENAITNHQDISELYWQLVGDEWEVSHQNITAVITLPQSIQGNELTAYGHGPLEGSFSIDSPTEITYQLDKLSPNEFFESRVIFPTDWFSSGAVGSSNKQEIVAQEEGYIKETENEISAKKNPRHRIKLDSRHHHNPQYDSHCQAAQSVLHSR